MSNRDIAKTLIDQIPETRLFNVILFLQGGRAAGRGNAERGNSRRNCRACERRRDTL
jgi:hypothetical protein